MKNTLFSGQMIGALVALIGAVGLLNTPFANAEPNCDKASPERNNAGNVRCNTHCLGIPDPNPECSAAPSNPHFEGNCEDRGEFGVN